MNKDWIDINKELPENQKLVQIAYSNYLGNKLVTVGWYCGKYEVEADFDWDDDFDYSEEKDCYFVKEGWRSQCLESEYYYTIDNVTHFAPLLKHPAK
jgi:hypothetical protein